jgi:hypothetical protein
VPLAGFTSWCADGKLHDAPTIAALHLAQAFIQNERNAKRPR